MWRLKIAEGGGPWMRSTNNFAGRQIWEFDANLGTPEEIAEVERVRAEYRKHRFEKRQSEDLLMRMQFSKQNPLEINLPVIKLEEEDDVREEDVVASLRRALSRFSTLQAHDGHWPGDFGGIMFLLPGYVIVLSVTGELDNILSPEHRQEIRRFAYNHQNEDGGWGMHSQGPSTMFGTVMYYVALRLLGVGPDDGEGGEMEKARNWVRAHGGATSIPSWGKFWLSVLGMYDWSGNNPLPPELWLAPSFLPIHPGRLWAHIRTVYASMCYIYAKRFVGPITPTILALREELYTVPYHQINWNKACNEFAKEDVYDPHVMVQDILWGILRKFVEPILMRRWPLNKLREKALSKVIRHVHSEDENTCYLCFTPVVKALNMLACYIEDPNSEAFRLHLPRVYDFLWLAEDGMRVQLAPYMLTQHKVLVHPAILTSIHVPMPELQEQICSFRQFRGYIELPLDQTTDGSQLWETALAIQAICATNLAEEYSETLKRAHEYIKNSQIRENCPADLNCRHMAKGAWSLSSRDHGWASTDCTGEALKAALLLARISPEIVGEPLELRRTYDVVDCLLSWMNKNGGFATYELVRSYSWVEHLNPTDTFAAVVIDYPYVECTSSVIDALVSFRRLYPGYCSEEVDKCIAKGACYIESIQERDGSWYGSWGVCFIYATWFGIRGLIAAGRTCESSAIKKARDFLLSKQHATGGWGESYLSAETRVYTDLEAGRDNAVSTAWAMLGLMEAGQMEIDPKPLHHAAKALINTQIKDGEFPQQEHRGMAIRTLVFNYPNYRNIFPIWALGEYRHRLNGGKSD